MQTAKKLSAAGKSGRRSKAIVARRRRAMASAVGALTFLSAVPLTVAAFTGTEVSLPGMDGARNILAMLKDRSPGDRTEASLVKTKSVAEAVVPSQRALGKITKPALPKDFVEAIAPPVAQLAELLPKEVLFAEALPPTSLTPIPPGGGGGILIPPPGGGGGGSGGGNPPPAPPEEPPPPPPVVPAVPEPGTWAMMLVGFGGIGWSLRRNRQRGATASIA